MLVSQSVGYIGPQLQEGFIGYLHEGTFFAVLSVDEGLTHEEGQALFTEFKNELHTLRVTNLSTFEAQVTSIILKLNFPAHFSLAIGFLYNDVLYVKTVGNGQIYFRRAREFDLLMDGDKSASGYVQEYDLTIFTTAKINELLGTVEDIRAFVDLNPPKEITEKLTNEGYTDEANGYASLFVEFLSQEAAELSPPPEEESIAVVAAPVIGPVVPSGHQNVEQMVMPPQAEPNSVGISSEVKPELIIHETPVVQPIEQVVPVVSTPASIPTVPPPIKSPSRGFTLPFLSGFQFHNSKKISLIIVVILFGILLWSVVFGYQRRMAAELQKKVETTQVQIESNLAKAEEDAYINVDGSLALIEESKELLSSLKEEVGTSHADQISKLATLIQETESKIVKRDEKEATEFYDLGLEAENAEGESIYLEDDKAAILDKKNNTVYILSLDSKSIDKYTSAEVGGATLVATYEDSVYILNPSKGVYEFKTSTKAERKIEADNWDNVVDMKIYNGNIYVLDEGSNDIYKYVVTESGFGEKISYFPEGQTIDVKDGVSMTIDSALYITKPSETNKFIAGAADPFATKYPEAAPTISGIFTTADIEQVYVWDTKAGSIYVLAKDGEYNRQVTSNVLRKAKGVFVYKDEAYVFDGKKLYTVSLD